LFGLRHGTRNRFTPDTTPFLLGGADRLLPEPLGERGPELAGTGLVLSSPEQVVWITDTRYADFSVEIQWQDGRPPTLSLGGVRIGDERCPWPRVEPPNTLRVERRGEALRLSGEQHSNTCSAPLPERVAIGIRGPESGTSEVQSVVVHRNADR
jgi:hypothetical protein